MKTSKILLIIIAHLVCLNAKSQLSVNSQGNVALNGILSIGATHDSTKCVNIEKIMPDRTAPLYGVYAHTLYPRTSSSSVGPMFGVVGFADASNPNEASMPMPIVGVYGRASKCSEHLNSFSAGVAGMCNYYNGVAVYGGIGDNNATVPYTSLGTYAGYLMVLLRLQEHYIVQLIKPHQICVSNEMFRKLSQRHYTIYQNLIPFNTFGIRNNISS